MNDGIVKSPLNQIIGKLESSLRKKGGLELPEVAPTLGVRPSYLKAIEAGIRALPPSSAPGMSALFGLNFFCVSSLLALADRLDARKGGVLDLPEIKARATSVSNVASYFSPILEWFINAVERLEAKESLEEDDLNEVVVRLEALVRDTPFDQTGKSSPKSKAPLVSHSALSPLFEDIIDSLASQLALFPPHTNPEGFRSWEKDNASRIISVRGYISDPDLILTSVDMKSEERFDWSFLRKSLKPSVQLLVPLSDNNRINRLENQFRDRLTQYLIGRSPDKDTSFAERVTFKSGADFLRDCEDGLLFDFTTRGMPVITEDQDLTVIKMKIENRQVLKCTNAWLYELKSISHDLGEERTHRIGFLDNYSKGQRTPYAVVMNREQVSYWWQLFEKTQKNNDQLSKQIRNKRDNKN